jgi:hypothetical protein
MSGCGRPRIRTRSARDGCKVGRGVDRKAAGSHVPRKSISRREFDELRRYLALAFEYELVELNAKRALRGD